MNNRFINLALVIPVLILLFFVQSCSKSSNIETSKGPVSLQEYDQKISYLVGYSIAQQMSAAGMLPDEEAMLSAIKSIENDRALLLDQGDLQRTLALLQSRAREQQILDAKQANIEQGLAFLEENKNKDGVVTLGSGVQYQIIVPGDDKKLQSGGVITAHYTSSLLDGTVFENTYDEGGPVSFSLSDVIEGWQKVLPLMSKGAKWRLWVPYSLAYPNGTIDIPGGSTLSYELEIVEVSESTSE